MITLQRLRYLLNWNNGLLPVQVPVCYFIAHEHSLRCRHTDSSMLRKMFEAYKLTENRDLMMNSILYEYLYLLACRFPQKNISSTEKRISYIEDALKYIELNYSEAISVQSLADWLNLEHTYLYRLFKSILHVSPQEYLLDFRIRQACNLLKTTDFSVSNIARSVGYEDALYFSRLFHRKKGMTPSRYREQATQAQKIPPKNR